MSKSGRLWLAGMAAAVGGVALLYGAIVLGVVLYASDLTQGLLWLFGITGAVVAFCSGFLFISADYEKRQGR